MVDDRDSEVGESSSNNADADGHLDIISLLHGTAERLKRETDRWNRERRQRGPEDEVPEESDSQRNVDVLSFSQRRTCEPISGSRLDGATNKSLGVIRHVLSKSNAAARSRQRRLMAHPDSQTSQGVLDVGALLLALKKEEQDRLAARDANADLAPGCALDVENDVGALEIVDTDVCTTLPRPNAEAHDVETPFPNQGALPPHRPELRPRRPLPQTRRVLDRHTAPCTPLTACRALEFSPRADLGPAGPDRSPQVCDMVRHCTIPERVASLSPRLQARLPFLSPRLQALPLPSDAAAPTRAEAASLGEGSAGGTSSLPIRPGRPSPQYLTSPGTVVRLVSNGRVFNPPLAGASMQQSGAVALGQQPPSGICAASPRQAESASHGESSAGGVASFSVPPASTSPQTLTSPIASVRLAPSSGRLFNPPLAGVRPPHSGICTAFPQQVGILRQNSAPGQGYSAAPQQAFASGQALVAPVVSPRVGHDVTLVASPKPAASRDVMSARSEPGGMRVAPCAPHVRVALGGAAALRTEPLGGPLSGEGVLWSPTKSSLCPAVTPSSMACLNAQAWQRVLRLH
mmetsp:Transcript_45862/g.127232  ORF Transcript_45862/g.127232 Transcript_45862/m.127232 type:complete len:575 (+) Transcript_45862:53-1777(+)